MIDSPVRLSLFPEDKQFLDTAPTQPDLLTWQVHVHVCDMLPDPKEVTIRYSNPTLQIGTDAKGLDIRYYRSLVEKNQPIYACSRRTGYTIDITFLHEYAYYQHPMFRIWEHLYLEETLLENKALILHACYLEYHGEAILFTAPSGTGKTTQAKLWETNTIDLKGPDAPAIIRNGDKVCIRPVGDTWYACGYPFHGSAPECTNIMLPIRAIVVVRQSPVNQILPLSPVERFKILMEQCTVPHYEESHGLRSFSLIEELICQGPQMPLLACTMETEAFTTLYAFLYGES